MPYKEKNKVKRRKLLKEKNIKRIQEKVTNTKDRQGTTSRQIQELLKNKTRFKCKNKY